MDDILLWFTENEFLCLLFVLSSIEKTTNVTECVVLCSLYYDFLVHGKFDNVAAKVFKTKTSLLS